MVHFIDLIESLLGVKALICWWNSGNGWVVMKKSFATAWIPFLFYTNSIEKRFIQRESQHLLLYITSILLNTYGSW
ncbi:hypothetical protein VL03_10590 [Rossellomorea marisflavi]|nr:hypothetical protein VL03_10590 [Rossellomorea marisflavi]